MGKVPEEGLRWGHEFVSFRAQSAVPQPWAAVSSETQQLVGGGRTAQLIGQRDMAGLAAAHDNSKQQCIVGK